MRFQWKETFFFFLIISPSQRNPKYTRQRIHTRSHNSTFRAHAISHAATDSAAPSTRGVFFSTLSFHILFYIASSLRVQQIVAAAASERLCASSYLFATPVSLSLSRAYADNFSINFFFLFFFKDIPARLRKTPYYHRHYNDFNTIEFFFFKYFSRREGGRGTVGETAHNIIINR